MDTPLFPPTPISAESPRAALLTLQAGRRGSAPIFCVPGAGDSVTAFISLAEALGPPFTLHGFQPQGLIDGEVPHGSVEAAASSYVPALLREHPSGPYHLLGHSFGGWIVLEIALQMRALGRTPTSIALIDTEAPGQPPREYSGVEALLELASLIELQGASPLNLQASHFESLQEEAQVKLLHQRLTRAGLLPAWSDLQDFAALFRVFATNLRTSYRPRTPCQQAVDLFWAPERDAPEPPHMALWHEWAPTLHLHRMNGNHTTMLEPPHVAGLAQTLQMVMSRAAG